METWCLNHVLGLSLSVLVLGLPGPLVAGTPGANGTEPVTASDLFSSSSSSSSSTSTSFSSSSGPAEGLGKAGNSTTAGSGESLSPSQRNILLTHTAETHTASPDTEQTFTETSSRSVEAVSLSEPLTSSLVVATTEASSSSDWTNSMNTDVSSAAFLEASSSMLTEEARLPQDSPGDTTLRLGDAPASVSFAADRTDGAYASTTSRARNLLSVTSSSDNSTSSVFTEDSHQPRSTWGTSARAAETEDYTHSALSTRTDGRDATDGRMTESFKGTFSETGSPGPSGGTQIFDGHRDATGHQHTSASEDTSDSTPALRVTEPSTDQSEVSVSSAPPVTSPAEAPMNISGTDQDSDFSVGTATESSVGAHSSITENQGGTEGVWSQTADQSASVGLTTAGPTVSSNTRELDDFLTETPALLTEAVLTTTPVTATDRSQITEEETFKASTTTTTTTITITPLLPAATSSRFSSTTSSSTTSSPTEAAAPYVTPSTTASTPPLRTSAARPTRRMSPSQTQGPSTGVADPTNATTLQIETSTGTLGVTTARSQHTTSTSTTLTHSTPTRSTVTLQTTGKQTERGTTQLVTSPTDSPTMAPPPPPRDPCVSNPCMNGGMCVSFKGHQYICHCQQAWTGPNCTQDTDECERDPCPAGSRCVNTRGSFSCECPLGFDLEDGRTCTKAKTFLGTFSVNRLPHDPIVFRSSTMHEIQREIIQLLNASLSVFRGYSRSTLSKKGEDGVRILAVNMFSLSTDVTSAEVYNSIQMFLSNCSSSLTHCRMVLHHQLSYHVESLCVAQKTQCDTERSTCVDNSGSTSCQCLEGYYKHNPDDLSCLDCGDGYKLENGTCVPCMFGFGGFNCGNFYKLIAVVVSPAGGALLLILIIALIVTCCKRDKNDINKIIFKSGDLQMSPYADFPKNNRISMEWGRETIEMQENGSTKNLLQMTDIYYSPALRNSDLERNGLYPFTGLPGSRHSCIYPAQWNPSFISDDSRRRDYF